jgi:hypothetical protein
MPHPLAQIDLLLPNLRKVLVLVDLTDVPSIQLLLPLLIVIREVGAPALLGRVVA